MMVLVAVDYTDRITPLLYNLHEKMDFCSRTSQLVYRTIHLDSILLLGRASARTPFKSIAACGTHICRRLSYWLKIQTWSGLI